MIDNVMLVSDVYQSDSFTYTFYIYIYSFSYFFNYVFFLIMVFSRYMPCSGIVGSYWQ